MSNAAPGPAAARQGPFESLAPHREKIGYGLIGLAAAFLVIPLVAFLRYGVAGTLLGWWGIMLALVSGAVAGYLLAPPAPGGPPTALGDRLRLAALFLGGGLGFFTALFGLLMPFYMPGYEDVFSKGIKEWREHPTVLLWTGLALFGGLVLMFLGLTLARAFERTQAGLRRLLYGYNAVFSSLLLAAVLGLINILPYSDVYPFSLANKAYDWTSKRIYTLDSGTVEALKAVKQPVKVFMLLRGNDPLYEHALTMLQNCRDVTPQITFEHVSPDSPRAVAALQNKYRFAAREGLLVVYGDNERTALTDFIPADDLVKDGRMARREQGGDIAFTGTSALRKSLDYLASGKARAHVYFLQGNDELEVGGGRGRGGPSASTAFRQLPSVGNIEAHVLRLGPEQDKVPEDADVVIVAGPRRRLSDIAVKALADYMKGARAKKGKLIVMLGVVEKEGKMVQTGLEPLLREFGVKVGDERVLAAMSELPTPTLAPAEANEAAFNPLARGLAQLKAEVAFLDARPVEPAVAGPASPYTVETILQVDAPYYLAWREKRLDADPEALAADLRRDPKKRDATVSKAPIPVAVAVSEGRSPGDPHGATPRLLAFGDASWIDNEHVLLGLNFTLLYHSIGWLRERPAEGVIAADEARSEYTLKVPVGGGARLLMLPGALLVLGVIGLGLGVWVVRRR
jgi:hypothetical protein